MRRLRFVLLILRSKLRKRGSILIQSSPVLPLLPRDRYAAPTMTRASAPNALYELRNPSSAEAQVEALRQLKNEIVGHDQRKELIVRHGVVRPLARILDGGRRKSAKRRRTETNGHTTTASSSRRDETWTIEDEVRLQAVMVVGSLALGIVLRPFPLESKS